MSVLKEIIQLKKEALWKTSCINEYLLKKGLDAFNLYFSP